MYSSSLMACGLCVHNHLAVTKIVLTAVRKRGKRPAFVGRGREGLSRGAVSFHAPLAARVERAGREQKEKAITFQKCLPSDFKGAVCAACVLRGGTPPQSAWRRRSPSIPTG